jgi:hypothetical protein
VRNVLVHRGNLFTRPGTISSIGMGFSLHT